MSEKDKEIRYLRYEVKELKRQLEVAKKIEKYKFHKSVKHALKDLEFIGATLPKKEGTTVKRWLSFMTGILDYQSANH